MFEIAAGIVLAYLVIRFRHFIAAVVLAPIIVAFSHVVTRAEARRLERPKFGSPEYLDWANREGSWRDRDELGRRVPEDFSGTIEVDKPPMPPRGSPEYLDWANREGRWAARNK